MNKRRSISTTIAGIIILIIGASQSLLRLLGLIVTVSIPTNIVAKLSDMLGIIIGITTIICGIFILYLKNWARISFIVLGIFTVLSSVSFAIPKIFIMLPFLKHKFLIMLFAAFNPFPVFISSETWAVIYLAMVLYLILPKIKEEFSKTSS